MKRFLLIFALLFGATTLSAQTIANLVATGTSIKWYAAATGGTALASATPLVNATTYYASQTVNGVESTARFAVTATVNPLPVPTFTAQPGATANTATNLTYTTQPGKTSYIWTYPGTLNTDYTITSGGGNTNSVTLKYVTTGIKTVTIKYSANGCAAASAISSTATTVTVAYTPSAIPTLTTNAWNSDRTLIIFDAKNNDLVGGTLNVYKSGGSLVLSVPLAGGLTNQFGVPAVEGDTFYATITAGSKSVSGNSNLIKAIVIGDAFQGGMIAYIDGTGLHGLIAATVDQSSGTGIEWINGGSTLTSLNGNTSKAYGTGQANTNFMKAQTGFIGGAAKICDDYTNLDNGTGVYSDWYLPSIDELKELFLNLYGVGGFTNGDYWSSSEFNKDAAESWYGSGSNTYGKSNLFYVRAVRSF